MNIRFATIALVSLLQGCGGNVSADSGHPDAGEDATIQPSVEAGEDAEDQDSGVVVVDAGSGECLRIAQVQCELWYRCAPTWMAATFLSQAACVEENAALCDVEMSSPGVAFTRAEYLACAVQMSEASCEDYLQSRQYETPTFPACDLPLGTSEDGQSCLFDSSCASGFCDRFADPPGKPALCGTCQPPPEPHGGICLGVTCAAGEICWKEHGSTEEPHCVEAAGIGEPCDDKPCLDGSLCANGVCPPPAFGKEGAPCDPAGDRSVLFNSYCYLWEYYCDGATHTCVPLPTPVGAGEPCDLAWTLCAGGGSCYGTCRPAVPLGSACEEGECVNSAVCQDGICQLPSVGFCD